MKNHELKEQHLEFCLHYLAQPPEERSATKSSIAVGYSAKTAHVQGCRLLKNVKIKAFIDEELAKVVESLENKLLMSREGQLMKLESICNKCMAEEPVMVRDESGMMIPSGEYKFDSKSAISAISEQNKMMGYNVPEKTTSSNTYTFNFGVEPEDESLLEDE